MQAKQIHIVFQVLNFLKNSLSHSYFLSADEKLLLIFLAQHKGEKGIFPKLQTLARELNRNYRSIRRTLNKLKNKQLVSLERRIGTPYRFTLLLPDLSTTEGVDALSGQNELRASTPSDSGRGRPHPQGVDALTYNNSLNNKEITERHSPVFLPDQKRNDLCFKRGLDTSFMTEKFNAYNEAHGKKYKDEQAAFELFVLNEKAPNGEIKKHSNGNGKPKTETVREDKYQVCTGCDQALYMCRCKISTKETSAYHMKDILKKIGLNGKGTKECLTGENMEHLARLKPPKQC